MMTNGDPEGTIYQSYPHINNGFFSCSPLFFLFENKLPNVSEYAKIQFHMMKSLKHSNDVTGRQFARVPIQLVYEVLT